MSRVELGKVLNGTPSMSYRMTRRVTHSLANKVTERELLLVVVRFVDRSILLDPDSLPQRFFSAGMIPS